MFAPNTRPPFHHREPLFHRLMLELEGAFLDLAGLPKKDWTVLFLTGSGSLGLEAVIYSATRPITPLFVDYKEAEFARRIADLTFTHRKHGIGTEDVIYPHYETAASVLNNSGWKAKGVTVVDCVSSFPFHPVPPDADVVVTVSGKQLGAPPGIVVIAVHNRVWGDKFFSESDRRSYLNLSRYRSFREQHETPNTPAITLLYDLWRSIVGLDREALIQKVETRFSALKEEAGCPDHMSPPVFTFKGRLTLHKDMGLYGKDRTQLFLWHTSEESDWEFDLVLSEIRRMRREGSVSALWRA